MSKDSKNDKIKYFSKDKLKLPEFINNNLGSSEVATTQGTNVIRVPFGIRLSKKKRPEKNQNIATLILPITSINSPTPPPNVA
tara:strand:+ start:138 stop:386 length:249 start_codon:yes stop_codon:yes gene_type:complete